MLSFIQFIVEEEEKLPARHVSYNEFKHPKEGHSGGDHTFDFNAQKLRTARKNHPDKKHWLHYSFGASWHDPQLMGRIVSGHNPPPNVKTIENGHDLKNAWQHAKKHHQEISGRAHKLSREGY